MPSSFSVSNNGLPVLPLDRGRGVAAFTVSNVSAVPVRGRLVATPLGDTPAAWVALDGPAERDFATNQAEQVSVKVVVPDGTPAADHPFRLCVYSLANPDTDYTDGPVVTFAVNPPPPKKPLPKWVIPVAIAAAVLLAGVAIAVAVATAPATVPDVTGLKEADAGAKVEAAGLKWQVKDERALTDDPSRWETVESQTPPGSVPGGVQVKLPKGQTVLATLFESGVLVPDVTSTPGRTRKWVDDAEKELREAKVTNVKRVPTKQLTDLPGRVIRQDVRNAKVSAGRTVEVTIEGVEVPNVVGKYWDEVKPDLEKIGLIPQDPEEIGVSGEVAYNRKVIKSQTTRAGTWVQVGTRFLSKAVRGPHR